MVEDGCAVVVEGVGGKRYTLSRRGGRVVECGGLENRYVGNPGIGGSNPPLSAGGFSAPDLLYQELRVAWAYMLPTCG